MNIATVADLKAYLAEHSLSPEALSQKIPVSNMTLRRLIVRAPETQIPARYLPAFALLSSEVPPNTSTVFLPDFEVGEFAPFVKDLETAGSNVRIAKLKREVKTKLAEAPVKSLRGIVKSFLKSVDEPSLGKKSRMLLLGALVYFLNPFDCVPDAMLGVGFLDDLGVFSLVAGMMKQSVSRFKCT